MFLREHFIGVAFLQYIHHALVNYNEKRKERQTIRLQKDNDLL